LIAAGVLHRLLALTQLKFSNSMIDAWWCSLQHQWLFFTRALLRGTVGRLVAFSVDEHNRVLPQRACRGQTPDEMYIGAGHQFRRNVSPRLCAPCTARPQLSSVCQQ
jgi:putative transposase